MAGKWDELETIGRRIRDGDGGNKGLLKQLVEGYRPFLSRKAAQWGLRKMSAETFDMLCNAGTDHGLKRWNKKKPLAFCILRNFIKEYRAAFKLSRIIVDEELLTEITDIDTDDQSHPIDLHPDRKKLVSDIIDGIEFHKLVRKEILLEKVPCPKIMFERDKGDTKFKIIATELNLSERDCINHYNRNANRMAKRMFKKYPRLLKEYFSKG